MRTQAIRGEQGVSEIRGIVVDPVLLFDPPPRLGPSHDRVAIGLGQGRVNRNVVQGGAVRKEPPTLRSAWVLAR